MTVLRPLLPSRRRARAFGRLSGDSGAFSWPVDDPLGYRAYGWMRDQMARRIPGVSGEWPVWVWAKRSFWRRRRPGHVLLSAVVPASRALWSDDGFWRVLLNGGPVAVDAAARNAWSAEGGCPVAAEATWEACLDILRRCPGDWLEISGRVRGHCDGIAWIGDPACGSCVGGDGAMQFHGGCRWCIATTATTVGICGASG